MYIVHVLQLEWQFHFLAFLSVEFSYRDAPQWKQRIAGKSLPMEKFVVKKTERFFAQKKKLVLPAVELLYVWNLFKILGKKRELMQNMYKIIEKALAKLDAHKSKMLHIHFQFCDIKTLEYS